MGQVIELLRRIPKQYYLPLGVGCISLILLGYGLVQYLSNSSHTEKVSFQKISQSNSASDSAALGTIGATTISIDIEGAVASPSVYEIPASSRIKDAVQKAGGFSGKADTNWIAKHLNLASKLTDGAKIYIPEVGETVDTGSINTFPGTTQDSNKQININSATSDELDSLPGVGPVTAQKIIAGRPYNSIQELQTKKIVSNSIYLKIKDSIIIF